MHVIIIGGGVMGMSCAWRLSQRGARVTLLDQGAFGKGASGAALGALWPSSVPFPGALQRLHRESLWQYPQFVKELAAAADRPVRYLLRGKMELIKSEAHREQCRQEAESACSNWPAMDGVATESPAMECIGLKEARSLEPHITVGELGAVVCHRSAQIDISDLSSALESACRRAGVEMLPNSKVLDVDIDADRPGVRLADREVKADRLLICAGIGTPGLSEVLRELAPVKPVKGQAVLLVSREPVIHHIVKNEAIFLVPWPDGRILLGSTTEPEAGYDTSNTVSGVELLTHGAIKTCPALADARIESMWGGLRPTGPKRKPLMGPLPGRETAYVCAGHFKIGIGMTPRAADLMARWISGEATTEDERAFAPTTPSGREN